MNSAMDCELCIVGAGISGLNALHSASCYLKPDDRVFLIDERDAPGGMWIDTYDFVRLHQPHPMFTVGNIGWERKMPPSHLANKEEVAHQLSHCLDVLKKRVNVETLFSHRYLGHREFGDSAEGGVEVEVESLIKGNRSKINARRLIKSPGYDIKRLPALALSSSLVHSVSPDQEAFSHGQIRTGDAPIFIVGGGKTAMDTALNLYQRFPHRELVMIIGDGVTFADRSRFYMQGWRRWFGGLPLFEGFLEMALRFDPRDVQEQNNYRLKHYGMSLSENPRQCQLALISPEEFSTIRNGVGEIIEDYLENVVDAPSGPVAEFRSGKSKKVPRGSCFVNCTGYMARKRLRYEPYVSESGRVVSINQSSMPFFLTSFNGYFLTHLMYREKHLRVPLYAMDMTELADKNKEALGSIAEIATVLNVLLLMKALPVKVFSECLLDFNRWYPLPRRLPSLLRYMLNRRRYVAHCRSVLDQFARENDVKVGVLPHVDSGRSS